MPSTPVRLSLVARCLVVVTICAMALRPTPAARANAPAAPQGGGTFYVNSVADTNAGDTVLTLREALLLARGGTNAGPSGLGGPVTANERLQLIGCTFNGSNEITTGCGPGFADTIVFTNTLGTGLIITLTASLPAITDTATTILDGYGVTLNAQALPAASDVLSITSSYNQITRLLINNAPRDALVVTGSHNDIGGEVGLINAGRYGLRVDGGDDNQLHALWLGIRPFAGLGVCADGNASGGVILQNGAISNTLDNVSVRCNGGFGVAFEGAGVTDNVLRDSLITNQTSEGVLVVDSAHDNIIGQPSFGNQITSNGTDGILVSVSAHDNLIYSNFIGVQFPGLTAAPNQANGIRLANSAHDNHIGEAFSVAERNYISGNGSSGVRLETGAYQNLVESNFIGLSILGTSAIPNGSNGVTIISADDNTIGGSTLGAAQYIAGNTGAGVYIEDSTLTFVGQTVQIGLGSDNATPLGNGGNGVWLVDATNNAVFATLIAHNGEAGVRVTGSTALGNDIAPREVRSNGGLPIDLDPLGPTPNDLGDADIGPNHLLNYPVVTNIVTDTVSGTACANCEVLIYEAFGDPSQAGGGALYRASVTANGAGLWSATIASLTRAEMTLLACASPCFFAGDTSEFSPRPIVLVPIVVR